MSFRYENYGTADLLSVSGTTVTSKSAIFGTAFYQTARAKCFDLPATAEVWMKFDVYFDGTNRWRAYNGGSNGTTGITAQTNNGLSFFAKDTNVSPNGANIAGVCKTKTLQTFLLHMISGSSAGVVEAWVDGTKIYTYTGDVNHGEEFADIYLQSDGAGTYFSNVIISDEEIGLTENAQMPFTLINDVTRELTTYSVFSIGADTRREVTNSFLLFNDTVRVTAENFSLVNDTARLFGEPFAFENDTERILAEPFSLENDTRRELCGRFSLSCDTITKVPHMILLDALM